MDATPEWHALVATINGLNWIIEDRAETAPKTTLLTRERWWLYRTFNGARPAARYGRFRTKALTAAWAEVLSSEYELEQDDE